MKVHLFMTCLVTNIRRDGSISPIDRGSALMECLESLSIFPFSSASFHIEIGPEVNLDQKAFGEALSAIADNASFSATRLQKYGDWVEALKDENMRDSDVVIVLTYEDHILRSGVESELLSTCQMVVESQESTPRNRVISILSHFSEQHILATGWDALGFRVDSIDSPTIPAVTPIGCLATTMPTLDYWFDQDFTSGSKLVSTENYFGPSVQDGGCISLVGQKELFFHLDGYAHVGLMPLDEDDSRRFDLRSPGLLGRSRTWQALSRCDDSLTLREFVNQELQLGFAHAVGVSTRSLFNAILRAALRGFAWFNITRRVIEKKPRLGHLLSLSLSHGLSRFVWINLVGGLGVLSQRVRRQ